jgi:hypothetical protein
LVGLSNLFLLLQEPKANQRVQKPHVFLPKSSFHCSTNPKTPLPLLSLAFEPQNYPPATGYGEEMTIHFVLFLACVRDGSRSFRIHERRDQRLGFQSTARRSFQSRQRSGASLPPSVSDLSGLCPSAGVSKRCSDPAPVPARPRKSRKGAAPPRTTSPGGRD